jgi:hypothetical protein
MQMYCMISDDDDGIDESDNTKIDPNCTTGR